MPLRSDRSTKADCPPPPQSVHQTGDGAMGYLGIMLIMRYHDDGGALVVQLGKQMHYLGSILGIEVTRRLIGKDELGTEDHGTGDGYSLLLTTR